MWPAVETVIQSVSEQPLESAGALLEVKDGSHSAFERLYRQFVDRVFNYLRHLTGDGEQAEELTQETFSRVWDKRRQYRPPTSPEVYLFRIARNLFFDNLRSSRSRRTVTAAGFPDATDRALPPDERVLLGEMTARVDASLRRMSPDLLDAYLLVRQQGMTYREAGEVLGLPLSTVSDRTRRALEHLGRELKPYLEA